MRRAALLFLSLLVLLSLTIFSGRAENLVSNPGFEAGTDGWHKYGGTFDVVAAPVHGEAAAARHLHSATGTKYLYQKVPVTAGEMYTLSAWVLANDPGIASVWLRIAWYDTPDCSGSQQGTENSSAFSSPDPSWRQLSMVWSAPAGAACAAIRLMTKVTAAGSTTYWDDVSLARASSPSASPTATPSSTPSPTPSLSPTPSPTPTSVPLETPSPTPSPTLTPTPTPTPRPTASPTATPSPTPLPFVAINEFLPAPAGTVDWDGDGSADSNDEWVELYNPHAEDVDVSGWLLDDAEGGSSPFLIPVGSIVPAYGFLVLYKQQTHIALNNGGDEVRLLGPNGSVVDRVVYPATERTDERSWSRTVDGSGRWTDTYPPSPGQPNQAATPTPTPLPADIWFWGFVYRGYPGETHTPLPGVRVTLYGRRKDGHEVPLKTYTTIHTGWFGIHTYADYPEYVLRAAPPAGMALTGAWTDNDSARVQEQSIVYAHPPNGTYARNFFFATPPGASVGPGGPGSLLIQEVQFDPVQSGYGEIRYEWVDLYNPLDKPVSLKGWTLTDASGASDPLPDLVLPPSGFLTLVADPGAFAENFPMFQGQVFSTRDGRIGNGLSNRGDALFLHNPLGMVVDAVSWGNNESAFSPSVTRGEPGTSIERIPPSNDSDTAADWVVQTHPAPGSVGLRPVTLTPTPTLTPSPTPTSTNTPSFTPTPTFTSSPSPTASPTPSPTPTLTPTSTATATSTPSPTPSPTSTATPTPTPSPAWSPTSTPTPSPTIPPTPPPFVAINEFLPAPAATVDWDGDGKADSQDEWIELYNPHPYAVDISGWFLDDGEGGSRPWTIPERTVISSGGFRVFFKRETHIALNNGGDSVRLLAPNGVVADEVTYVATARTDTTSWSRAVDGRGPWTDACSPSPGRPNCPPAPSPTPTSPPPPPSPTALPPTLPVPTPTPTTVHSVTSPGKRASLPLGNRFVSLADLCSLPLGSAVRVEGVVTIPPGLLHKRVFYIGQVGAGIRVYVAVRGWQQPPDMREGTVVRVSGTLSTYRRERQIRVKEGEEIQVVRCCQLLAGTTVKAGDLSRWEGTLVHMRGRIRRVFRRTLLLESGERTYYVYVPKATAVNMNTFAEGQWWDISGVVTRWKKGWQVVVRGTQDIRPVQAFLHWLFFSPERERCLLVGRIPGHVRACFR